VQLALAINISISRTCSEWTVGLWLSSIHGQCLFMSYE